MRRSLGLLLLLVTSLTATAACGGSDTSGSRDVRPGQAAAAAYTSSTRLTDWPTYHRTAQRWGNVAHAPQGALQLGWRTSLVGAVYGEPILAGDTLIVATERNYVYGLDARTGAQRWQLQLGAPQSGSGLPCGNVDPLGVTSTPAYDAATGSVFVVAETSGGSHTLWALDATTGTRTWTRNLDTQTNRNKLAEQQRSALLVTRGRVITVFGGLAGDCSNYVGYATSVPTDGNGATYTYVVPTAREAGMWSSPGAILGPHGFVYVASGNGAELHGTWDKSDSVNQLYPTYLTRRSIFAPSTWRDDNVHDHDLGSSSPAFVPSLDRIVIAGKRGVVYLLRTGFGGIGSQLAQRSGCTAFGGSAVVGRTVLMPCKGENSIRALHVGAHSLTWGWTRRGVYSSPVIAGTRVFAADQSSGDLVVMRLSTGAIIERHHVGPLPHFSSQVVSGDWVFVPTLDGITAFRGP